MKFIADVNLGKLAKELRMLGFDTTYYRGKDLHELIQLARRMQGVILTRNRGLISKSTEIQMILVSEDDPLLQLKGLLRRGIIAIHDVGLFTRCLLCNTRLEEIAREKAEGNVPDFIYQHHQAFYRCPQCHRLFWPGTHFEKMKKGLESLLL